MISSASLNRLYLVVLIHNTFFPVIQKECLQQRPWRGALSPALVPRCDHCSGQPLNPSILEHTDKIFRWHQARPSSHERRVGFNAWLETSKTMRMNRGQVDWGTGVRLKGLRGSASGYLCTGPQTDVSIERSATLLPTRREPQPIVMTPALWYCYGCDKYTFVTIVLSWQFTTA